MASTRFVPSSKTIGSPRPKGRENAKETLCRNVLIYGHCRYEDQGCAFNHEPNKVHSSPDVSKKSLSVESPPFTPSQLPSSSTVITSRIASAPTFTPRGLSSGTATPSAQSEDNVFNPSQIREFTPQLYDTTAINGASNDGSHFDPFGTPQAAPAQQYNPYLEDPNALTASNAAFYGAQTAFTATTQPLQYHLYAPIGLKRQDLSPHQRTAHDFFMAEKLREELQRRSEAAQQVMPNSQLPDLDPYHSLVALDTNNHKNSSIFGYHSWVYKAQSSKDGRYYCLRRIEGYRLTNEKAIQSVKNWKRIDNGAVVSVIDSFTTRAFRDSSIIFVYDYHPCSKTLLETHFAPAGRYGNRVNNAPPLQIIWSYIVQLASAIKAVHSAGLAVRCLEPSKIILASKNRIRLGACAVLDVVQYEAQQTLQDLQQMDLAAFGRLILQLVTSNINPQWALIEQVGTRHGAELKEAITWLCTPVQPPQTKSIDDFLLRISSHVIAAFDSSCHADDALLSELNRELENGRIARLMMKLGTINERGEYEGDRNWGETGDRYMLKLMRDYIFHQVDANGHPNLDMGHILRCLNKLDAGVDENICLTSRDEQSVFVVSWKELKKQVAAAFADLSKPPKVIGGVGGGRGY